MTTLHATSGPQRIVWLVGVSLAVLILLGLLFYMATRFIIWPLAPPAGDGTFRDFSRRPGIWPMYAYELVFDEFRLADDFDHVYRFAELPAIGRAPARVCLQIDSPEQLQRLPPVDLQLVLMEESAIKTIEHPKLVKAPILLGPGGGDSTAYRLAGAEFAPSSGAYYVLQVVYRGNPESGGAKARFVITCRQRD